jgi:hypothetical protein
MVFVNSKKLASTQRALMLKHHSIQKFLSKPEQKIILAIQRQPILSMRRLLASVKYLHGIGLYEANTVMRYTTNLTEQPSSIYEIFSLIEGKIIKKAADVGNEFQLQLSDDYLLRISGTEVNLVIPKNPPKKR